MNIQKGPLNNGPFHRRCPHGGGHDKKAGMTPKQKRPVSIGSPFNFSHRRSHYFTQRPKAVLITQSELCERPHSLK